MQGLWTLIKLVCTVFVIVALTANFVGRGYVVPSASMEPTFHGCDGCTNDRIVVERVSYYFSDPQPGDVIVFEAPQSWDAGAVVQAPRTVFSRGVHAVLAFGGLVPNGSNIMTKRVIATAGQVVSCEPGDPGIVVDGKAINQDFILSPAAYPVDEATGSQACGGEYFGPVSVPQGSLWVMGDNRTNSLDSRAHLGDAQQGTISVDSVRGKVRFIIMPFSRMGAVESAHLAQS